MKSVFSKLSRLLSSENDTDADEGRPACSEQFAPPQFSSLNKLEELLVAAATDPSARSEFNRELLKSDLLVATPDQPERSEQLTIEKDHILSILNVASTDGTAYPAIFTSEQRVAECFGPGTGFVAMQGAVLLQMVENDGAVLNPASAYGVRWNPQDLAAILGNPTHRVVEKDTQIMLGTPSHRPAALIAKLSQILEADERVQEAWLALAHWPETDEWSWYLDVRSGAPSDEISPQLAEAFAPDLLEGKPIDVVVNSPIGPSGTGIRLKPSTNH